MTDWKRSQEAAHEIAKLAAKLLDHTENGAYFAKCGTLTQRDVEEIRQECSELVSWGIECAESLKEQRVGR